MKLLNERGSAAVLGAVLLAWASGCGPAPESPPAADDPATDGTVTSQPDRGGIGMAPLPPPPPPPPPVTSGVDPQRSLVVTDVAILSKFRFEAVMDQLVGTSEAPTTALNLFQQWWDTARPASPTLGTGSSSSSRPCYPTPTRLRASRVAARWPTSGPASPRMRT